MIDAAAQEIARRHGLTLEQKIGEGSFKVVFGASGSSSVVIKIFKQALTIRDVREIHVCSNGKLKRVPRVYHAEQMEFKGLVLTYLIEQRLAGCTLTEYLRNVGSLTPVQGSEFLHGISLSLFDIWSNNLVHRDIKPDNIFVASSLKDIYVLDLGLARHLGDQSLTASWAMRGPGTPYFAPPEQLNNEKHIIDWRADQFSIGVTVALSCLGLHPYQLEDEPPWAEGTVSRVASRTGVYNPSFMELTATNGLEKLRHMCSLWPVDRVDSPDELTA